MTGEILRAQLPRDPTCSAVARRFVEEYLSTADADELSDANTLVSELVNNAFLHGKGRIVLRVSRRRSRMRIEVSDEGERAVLRAGKQDGYHGLDIVDALSLAWGAPEGNTRVWAELAAAGPASDRASSSPEHLEETGGRVTSDAGASNPSRCQGRSMPESSLAARNRR